MNKKILAVCTLVTASFPVLAQGPLQLPKHWQETIQQKVSVSEFNNSINLLGESLLLAIPVTKQYFPKYSEGTEIPYYETAHYRELEGTVDTYPSTTGCKAYALDDHWVMAGGTCLWNGRHTVDFTPSSATEVFYTGLVALDPTKENLKINGGKISWKNNLFIQPREHKVPHVILVRVPENTAPAWLLKKKAKINILAFKNSTPTDLQGGYFYINSARFGLNGTHKRTLQSNQTTLGIVTIEDNFGSISGVSTDPLAYIKNGQMRWIGVNQGITELRYGNLAGDWDGKPSNEYFYFNEEDANFIKDTISKHDPAAWQRIEERGGLEIL